MSSRFVGWKQKREMLNVYLNALTLNHLVVIKILRVLVAHWCFVFCIYQLCCSSLFSGPAEYSQAYYRVVLEEHFIDDSICTGIGGLFL